MSKATAIKPKVYLEENEEKFHNADFELYEDEARMHRTDLSQGTANNQTNSENGGNIRGRDRAGDCEHGGHSGRRGAGGAITSGLRTPAQRPGDWLKL